MLSIFLKKSCENWMYTRSIVKEYALNFRHWKKTILYLIFVFIQVNLIKRPPAVNGKQSNHCISDEGSLNYINQFYKKKLKNRLVTYLRLPWPNVAWITLKLDYKGYSTRDLILSEFGIHPTSQPIEHLIDWLTKLLVRWSFSRTFVV